MNKKYKSFFQILGVSILIFVVYIFIWAFTGASNKDIILSLLQESYNYPNKQIYVIEIDDQVLQKFGYPLDRKYLIPIINNLAKQQTAVIGIDSLFSEKSMNEETDKELAKAFKNAGNIILGYETELQSRQKKPIYDLFEKNVKGAGYFSVAPSSDGKVYGILPFQELTYGNTKQIYDSFSFKVLRTFYEHNKQKDSNGGYSNGTYNFFGKQIPIYDSLYNIFYLKSTSEFKRLKFIDVYNGNFGEGNNKVNLKDKIIIIGYNIKGNDEFKVPIVNEKLIAGMYIHINSINGVINEKFITYFDSRIELIIAFCTILAIIFFNFFYLKEKQLKWIVFGGFSLIAIFILIYVLFIRFSTKYLGIAVFPNNVIGFGSILFFSFFASSVLKYMNEDKNKKLLSKALGEYVSKDVAEEILNSSGSVNLSGENKKITIFFSDIAGFTTISEKLSPEELVSFLRVYLGNMSNIIMDNKGFINKYEGDAIMALWGVFGKVEKYGVLDACRSCLLQQRELTVLNERFRKEGKDILQVRMGLHTGNAITGNIGSEGKKMEFTALGDSVNLASRLEGVNKFYHTLICVSEEVYKEANEFFEFRYLDTIKVKGKNIGVNIYELICFKGELSEKQIDLLGDFKKGIDLYFARDFEKAYEFFSECEKLGDKTAGVYTKRCLVYMKNPPSENWDGIWVLDEK